MNCLSNNFAKIAVPVSLQFRLNQSNPEAAFYKALNIAMDRLNIESPGSLLDYMQNGGEPDVNFDDVINAIVGIGTQYNINAVKGGTMLKNATAMYVQTIATNQALLDTETEESKETNVIPPQEPTEVSVTDTKNVTGLESTDDLYPDSSITKLEGLKSLQTIQTHYLKGELGANPHFLDNMFKLLISRNWLSTREDSSIEDSFDPETIKKNIEKDAKDVIANYYRDSADAVSSLGNAKNVLFFTDRKRIPDQAECKKIVTDENGNVVMKIYTSSYTDHQKIVYVVADTIPSSMYDVFDHLKGILKVRSLDVEEIALSSVGMKSDPTMKPKSVNMQTAQDNMNDKRLMDAFFSIIIVNELDTLIEAIQPELTENFKEKFRTSFESIDIAGSNMATRMVNISIDSTPKVLSASNTTKTLEDIRDINTYLRESPELTFTRRLQDIGVLKANQDGSNYIKHNTDGIEYDSYIMTIGASTVIVSYDTKNEMWGFLVPSTDGTGKYNFYRSGSAMVENGLPISEHFKYIANTLSEILRSDRNNMRDELNKSSRIGDMEAHDMFVEMHSPKNLNSSSDEIGVNIASNMDGDGFLRVNDTKIAAQLLANLPNDLEAAGAYLLELSKKNDITSNVARSLYYKFFHPGEYSITEIDPITGKLKTTKHISIYERALRHNDQVAWNILMAIQTQLSSTVVDNKIFMYDGYVVRTFIQHTSNSRFLIDAINHEGLDSISKGQMGLLVKDLQDYFTVKDTNLGTQISFYEQKKVKNAVPTVTFVITGTHVTVSTGALNYDTVSKMLRLLKLPAVVRSVNFFDSIRMALQDSSSSQPLFFANLVRLRLANAVNEEGNYLFGESRLAANNLKKVRYDLLDNFKFYEDYISQALDTIYTRAFRNTVDGPKGTKFSISIYKNLSKDKRDIVRRLAEKYLELGDDFMFKDSALLTEGDRVAIVEEFTRLGLKVGLEGKDASELNSKELAHVLISSFLKEAKDSKFDRALSTDGTQSNRTKTDQFVVRVKDEFDNLAPKNVVDNTDYLDELKLRSRFYDSQKRAFSGLQRSLITSWTNALDKLNLSENEAKIDEIQKRRFDALRKLGRIKNKKKIDAINAQFDAELLSKTVSPQEIASINTLRDLYNILQKLQLDYATVAKYSGLIENFSIIKKEIPGREDPIASINYSMVQLSEVMLGENQADKDFYLDMFYNEFEDYMNEIGFELSIQDFNIIKDEFPFLKEKNIKDKEKWDIARTIAMKIYFYNESVIEGELAQFGMGSIFQYHKSKNTPLFESMEASGVTEGMSADDKINYIKSHNFSKKSTITINQTYDELFSIRPAAMAANSIKGIIETDGLTSEEKIQLIKYLDIMAQLSPMYIDRVKRNQGNGTSGMHPTLASASKPGALLDQTTHSVMVADSIRPLFSLNNCEHRTDIPYNGAQLAFPSYFIKINNSLGNNFNNFRSTAFLKSVNVSKTKEGVAQYLKSATFSLFSWETATIGTSELSSLVNALMDKMKFDRFDPDFEGLYLTPKEHIFDEQSGEFNEIPLDKFIKHGGYLGMIRVDIDGIGTMDINASILLNDLQRNRIDATKIKSIKTNKVLVTGINSKLDLYNYYGGAATNLEILNMQSDKEKFMDVYPFGWVEAKMVEIMGNYRGVNGNYPIRNAEVSTVEFQETGKTGRRNVNEASVISNKYVTADDIETYETDNQQLYIILQAEHPFDVTKSRSLNDSGDDNTVAMLTQTTSNSAMEGNTIREVMQMESALASLSLYQLKALREEIEGYLGAIEKGDFKKLEASERRYIADLMRRVLSTKRGAETAKEFIGLDDSDADQVAYDLRLLAPVLRTAVNAEYSRRAVKLRFHGGQYILSPSYDIVKTYAFNGSRNLLRNSINTNNDDNSINGILKKEITAEGFTGILSDANWELNTISTINQLISEHNELDYVYEVMPNGKYKAVRVASLRSSVPTAVLSEAIKAGKYVSPWIGSTVQINQEIEENYNRVVASVENLDLYGPTNVEIYAALSAKVNDGTATDDEIELLKLIEAVEGQPLSISEDVLSLLRAAGKDVDANMPAAIPVENLKRMITSYFRSHTNDQQEKARIIAAANPTTSNQGETLKWMQYFKDGVNLQETEEYLSYYLSASMPSVLSKLKTNQEKLAILTKEMGSKTPAVPKYMWARYMAWLDHTLGVSDVFYNSPVLGTSSVEAYYKKFSEIIASGNLKDSSLTGFFAYVESFKGKEQEFTLQFRFQLEHKLEEEGWEHKPSEFYMPPQHMAALLISYGDSIQDIVGTQEQPDIVKLFSLIRFTDREKFLLETKYIHDKSSPDMVALRKKISTAMNKLSPEHQAEVIKYLDLRRKQQIKMLSYFKGKIKDIEKSIAMATGDQVEAVMRKAPMMWLKYQFGRTKVTIESVKHIDELVKQPSILENIDLMNNLLNIKALVKSGIPANIEEAKRLVETLATAAKNDWATSLANNFEKTLTFITARIPSQAKQQTTVGKIKNFIYSTKNAIYAPIELLAYSGADFDIDKQNNMTWTVGNYGEIIDWGNYIKDPDKGIDRKYVDKILLDETVSFRSMLEKHYENSNLPNDKKHKEIQRKVNQFRRYRLERISQATQNFIVHKMIQIAGSSKNALEASTVTAMTKLGMIKEYMTSFKITEEDIKKYKLEVIEVKDPKTGNLTKRVKPNMELAKLIKSRQLAIPFSPSTKMIYEKINMDGSMGIAIFASSIKTYTTIFKATLSNEGVKEYTNNLDNTKLDEKDINNTKATYNKLSNGTNNDSIQYVRLAKRGTAATTMVYKNSKTGLYEESKPLEFVANSNKFIPRTGSEGNYQYPSLHTKLAKDAYRQIMFSASPGDEADVIIKYMESIRFDTDTRTTSQAWQDLSELLSAATDNAKEMILSVIGANITTSTIIATMIVMGVELDMALSLINDPSIKQVIKEFEDSKTLVGKREDFVRSLKSRLTDIADRFITSPMSEEESKTLRAAVKADLIKRGVIKASESIESELAEDKTAINNAYANQATLRGRYNPGKQMLHFNSATREFSMLSGILGINTNMPNTELDVFNYLMKVENALRLATKSEITLADFLSDKEGSESVKKKLIEDAEANKTAFNIPYIILKNEVFYRHIKTLFESNEMMKRMAYTNEILYDIVKPKVVRARKMRIEKTDLLEYYNLISNIAISSYYAKNKTTITIPGMRTFDLATSAGRLDFIGNIGKIKDTLVGDDQKLLNNLIIKELQASTPVVDPETGNFVVLLNGINTDINNESALAGYRLAMTRIKEHSPALYNALFHYSLIIDKMALSKSSIATLFGAEPYRDFAKHVLNLKKTGEMVNLVRTMGSARTVTGEYNVTSLELLLPFTLTEFSTETGAKNENMMYNRNRNSMQGDYDYVESDTDDEYGYGYQDDEGDYMDSLDDDSFRVYSGNKEMSKKYDVTNMNELHEKPGYTKYNIFRSKTNGLIYIWCGIKDVESYVPITKNYSSLTNNIDVSTGSISGDITNIESVGYGYGWEIQFGDGSKGRLLKYAGNQEYLVLTSEKGSTQTVKKVSKGEIQRSNPQFQLHDNYIRIKKGGFSAAETPTVYYNENTKELSEVRTITSTTRAYPISANTRFARDKNILNKGDNSITHTINRNDLASRVSTDAETLFFSVFTDTDSNNNYSSLIDEYQRYTIALVSALGKISKAAQADKVLSQSEKAAIVGDAMIKNKDLTLTHDDEVLVEIAAFFNRMRSSTTKEEMYMFLRMNNNEKIDYINKTLFNSQEIIPKNVPFNEVVFKADNENRQHKVYSETLDDFSVNKLLKMDLDFFAGTIFETLTVEDYVKFLEKVGISLDEYRRIMDFDIVTANGKVSIKPGSNPKQKYTIEINTERSVQHKKIQMQKVSPAVTTKLAKFLNKRFNNATVRVLGLEEIELLYPDAIITSSDQAFVNVGNNTIVLIRERATLDVLLHEMGHIYLANLKEKDIELYDNLMQKMQESEIFDIVNQAYSKKINYTKEDVLEEVFVITLHNLYAGEFVDETLRELDEQFDGMLDEGGISLGKVKNSFSSLFKEFLGVKSNKQLEVTMTDSIASIMRKIGIDLIFNNASALSDMNRNDIKNLKYILEKKNMTEAKAEAELIKNGLIRKYCD